MGVEFYMDKILKLNILKSGSPLFGCNHYFGRKC